MKKKSKKIKAIDKFATIGAKNYVEHSMSILDRIHELLQKKYDGKQVELAKALNKKESQISKWLNGVQNFTLFTIAQLEEVFGEPIIGVCTDNLNATFVQVVPSTCIPEKIMQIEPSGQLIEFTRLDTQEIDFDNKESILL